MFPALAARRKLVLLSDWTTKRDKQKETLLGKVAQTSPLKCLKYLEIECVSGVSEFTSDCTYRLYFMQNCLRVLIVKCEELVVVFIRGL